MSDAPTPSPEEPPPPEPDPGPEPIADPAKVLSDNRRLGKESADARKALKAAEAKIEELTKANMTEMERARAEWETAAAEAERAKWLPIVRDLRISHAAVGVMSEPELAGQLLANVDIDLDDPEAITTAIEVLVERHPSLGLGAGTPTPPGAPSFPQGPRGNGETPAPTMNDVLLDAFGMKRNL